ncbi:MAG: c-type cytochrome [Gemmatimonadaceae bacterium]
MPRRLVFLTAAALLVAAAPHSGGWAVITVHDVPTHLVAGVPTSVTFTIRQHGTDLMRGRRPSVAVRRTGAGILAGRERVRAEPGVGPGEYRATINPTETGSVTLTIDADYHTAESELLPIPVVASGAAAPRLSAEAHGRALYVAKGCVTCHSKSDDPALLERQSVRVGPDLGGRRFEAEWLATKIADPAVNRVPFNQYVVMPKLAINPEELTALVAYVNARVVASH